MKVSVPQSRRKQFLIAVSAVLLVSSGVVAAVGTPSASAAPVLKTAGTTVQADGASIVTVSSCSRSTASVDTRLGTKPDLQLTYTCNFDAAFPVFKTPVPNARWYATFDKGTNWVWCSTKAKDAGSSWLMTRAVQKELLAGNSNDTNGWIHAKLAAGVTLPDCDAGSPVKPVAATSSTANSSALITTACVANGKSTKVWIQLKWQTMPLYSCNFSGSTKIFDSLGVQVATYAGGPTTLACKQMDEDQIFGVYTHAYGSEILTTLAARDWVAREKAWGIARVNTPSMLDAVPPCPGTATGS